MEEPRRDAGAAAAQSSTTAAGQRPARRPCSVAIGVRGSLLHGCRVEPSNKGGRSQSFSSTASSAASSGAFGNEALSAFKKQRRFELAAQGKDLQPGAALKEWLALPEEERERFKREVRERRLADGAGALENARRDETESAAGGLLQKLREQENRKPTPAEIRARLTEEASASGGKKRKQKDIEKAEIRRPVFPQKQDSMNCADRADRRREIAGSVRTRTEGNKAAVTITSSHRVSLAEVSAQLSAPTLSCDWARRDDDDSDTEQPDLKVDMPAESEARKLMDDHLRRKISSAQVRRLVQTSENPPSLASA